MVLIIDQTAVGAATPTTITADMTPSSPGVGGTVGVANNSGWPNNVGRFPAVIDRDTPNEEKLLFSNSSGSTFTVAQRGYDGTAAKNHSTGATIEFILPASVILQIIQHVDDLETSPHSSKLPVGTIAAHDVTARHAFGAAFGTPGTPVALTPDIAGSAGTGARPAREDHVHNVPAATAGSITNANAEGSSGSFARADHNHAYGALSVDSGSIAANAIIAGKIADGGVNTSAKIADAIVTLAKMASEASGDYTPAATAFCSGATLTVGTGGTTYGHYFKLGRLVAGWAGFNMASDGNLPNPGTLQIPLPVAMRTSGSDGQRGFVAARARRGSDGFVVSGTGVITSGSSNAINIAAAGASATWDSLTPFNWGTPGDGAAALDSVFVYEAAT